jgi:hypothetical protein
MIIVISKTKYLIILSALIVIFGGYGLYHHLHEDHIKAQVAAKKYEACVSRAGYYLRQADQYNQKALSDPGGATSFSRLAQKVTSEYKATLSACKSDN